MKFFNPTFELKELRLLQHIESKFDCTQKELSEVVGAAVSMINQYINRLEEQGMITRKYHSPKTVHYFITPEGLKRKNYLLITYTKELLDLYKLAKSNVKSYIFEVKDKHYQKILLYGAGEVAETILSVLRDTEENALQVVAIIDDDQEKIGRTLMGYPIISSKDIDDYKHDVIVVTSYSYEETILGNLERIGCDMARVERFFMRGLE
ncbi:MAG: winged helix-turn-helix transcriptional regulator [Eubacteriales bacterium]|nr:winged helix-turn-helix transcriptional regulator [Eubacteriales bacterium]